MAVLLEGLGWLPTSGRRLSEHDPSIQGMGGMTVSDYLAAFYPQFVPPSPQTSHQTSPGQTFRQWLKARRAETR